MSDLSLEFAGAAGREPGPHPPRRRRWHPHLHGSDLVWAIAFLAPYAAVFIAFVVYPMIYGLWMGSDPSLYVKLLADPRYVTAAVNTVLFVGLAVNVQMFLALMLSGFFMRRRRWIKGLLVFFILPWTLPAVPAYLSFHWMLVADRQGLLDGLLAALFRIEGPNWFDHGWLALACDIVAYIWKWMPLWTLILLGGRMAIPPDLYEAAEVDGASLYRRFTYITVPLLANLYLISTLISAIWTFGDYTPVLFVSGGAPAFSSEVLSTLGFHYALDFADPQLGVAAGLSALPLLVPIVILLMHRLRTTEVQL
ncbi:MAG TPA: sugar ABC transporter permease [Stellaceae bacterium]|nr:sugar ABC transporter permease [Stellaceae bacterium]